MPFCKLAGQRSTESADCDRALRRRKGPEETGYVAGQNVTVEYHWLDGRYDCLPSLMTSHVGFRCVARN
jgi:hypothetical protein